MKRTKPVVVVLATLAAIASTAWMAQPDNPDHPRVDADQFQTLINAVRCVCDAIEQGNADWEHVFNSESGAPVQVIPGRAVIHRVDVSSGANGVITFRFTDGAPVASGTGFSNQVYPAFAISGGNNVVKRIDLEDIVVQNGLWVDSGVAYRDVSVWYRPL